MDTENKIVYNSWPVGKLPKEFQRPELDQIKALGYDWKDPRDVVKMFEEKVAKFSGSKYAVAIDCCSHGLFLAIKALERKIKPIHKEKIIIPSRTYVSVPMQIVHAGFVVGFEDIKWSGTVLFDGPKVCTSEGFTWFLFKLRKEFQLVGVE